MLAFKIILVSKLSSIQVTTCRNINIVLESLKYGETDICLLWRFNVRNKLGPRAVCICYV